MSIRSKYKWLLTYAGLRLLKKGLKDRNQQEDVLANIDFVKKVKIVNRVDFILDLCKEKNVLHVGFADHPFTEERIQNKVLLHLQLKNITSSLTGFDNNAEAIKKYSLLTGDEQVIIGDLMQMPVIDTSKNKFDIVILGEVMEHLPDPYQAADNISKSFPAGTIFLVTVPNYTSMDAVAGSLYKKEFLHPDHHWYLSPYTLLKLFSPDKFELKELIFGMYYEKGKRINAVMKQNPFLGDCIIAVFELKPRQ